MLTDDSIIFIYERNKKTYQIILLKESIRVNLEAKFQAPLLLSISTHQVHTNQNNKQLNSLNSYVLIIFCNIYQKVDKTY